MNKKALSLAVLVAGVYPATSYALSLGDIESNSNLNQPLRAKIELLSASAAEAKQMQVRLAPSSVFNRVGVDRPAFLDSLRFTSTVQNGRPVILVTSDAPIAEPFVNFLVEVSWPQGQLLKEYTVMLNPPVLMQPGTAFAGNEAAVRAEPRPASGAVNRAAPQAAANQQQAQQQRARQQQAQQQAQQQQAQQQRARQQQQARQQQAQQQQRANQQQAQQQQARQPTQSAARPTNRTYRVRSGDTLFKVATRLQQPGVNVDQMMMALYRANPKAFIKGNINGLKAGAVLRAPSARAANSTSRAQARRQVRQQYADWKKFRATLAQKTAPQRSTGNRSTGNQNQNASANKAPAAATTKPADPVKANTVSNANDNARLEVLGKTDGNAADKGNSAAGSERLSQLEQQLALARESMVSRQRENKELKSRVNDLESMLRKKNRLIALRDDQLAQLQTQLSDNGIQVATPGMAAGTQNNNLAPADGSNRSQGSDIQNQVANNSQPAQNQVVRAQQPDNVNALDANNNQQSVNSTQDNTTKPSTVFADQQKGQGDDLMSLLMSPMAWKIGAGALFSLLLLWLLSRLLGRRKSAPKKTPLVADDPVIFDADNDAMGGMREDQPFRELEAELNKAEQGTSGDDPFGVGGNRADSDYNDASSDIVEARSDQDEDETLMEANVYIAYGLHQQAESELQKALEKHPDRLEYRHKLLENYFASNNREEFDRNAEAFLETRGADRKSKMWREIAEWGKKISPDNTLYTEQKSSGMGAALAAGGAAVAGVAASAIALGRDDEPAVSSDASARDTSMRDDTGLDFPSASVADEKAEQDGIGGLLGDLQDDDDLGLDDFDFNLDDLESDLGGGLDESELPGANSQRLNKAHKEPAAQPDHELAQTIDDDLDFNLDDLAKELQQDVDAEERSADLDFQPETAVAKPAPAVIDETASVETLDFDELMSGGEADNGSANSPSDNASAPESGNKGKDKGKGGIGLIGGLAAGAAAVAGVATAAVASGRGKVADALGNAGDKAADALGNAGDKVDNALNFDDELPDLSAAEPPKQRSDRDHLSVLDFDQDLPELPDLDEALSDSEQSVRDGVTAAKAEAGGLDVDFIGDDDGITALDFDLEDLDAKPLPMLAQDVQSEADAKTELLANTANETANNVTNLNLHLDKESGLKKILPEDTFYTSEGGQRAANNAAGDAEEGDGWLGDIDDALSFLDMPDEEIDLHEAHISTKLDLARAYLDMGDIEGARSTLEEVMVEGNDNQRREAETLLHETG